MLENKLQQSKEILLGESTNQRDWLYYHNVIYVPYHVPLKLFTLHNHHDVPAAVHPGPAKAFELMSLVFYYRKMTEYIGDYTQN